MCADDKVLLSKENSPGQPAAASPLNEGAIIASLREGGVFLKAFAAKNTEGVLFTPFVFASYYQEMFSKI